MGNPNGAPPEVLWKKGQPSPNPSGRPVGAVSFKTQVQQSFLEAMSSKVKDQDGEETSFMAAYNKMFFRAALKEGSFAAKFISERLYGENLLEQIDAQVNREKRENADFMQFRIVNLGFDIQQKILMSKSRDIGLMAGRRGGKSEVGKLLTNSDSVKPGSRILIIGLTITKCEQIFLEGIVQVLKDFGLEHNINSVESRIELSNGSIIQFGGNANKMEREKYRGQWWTTIIVDEAQSQPMLRMMVEEILNPMLIDVGGRLILMGTGPRIPNTYFEWFYNNPSPSGLRLNWNLSHNPHILNYQTALQEIREKYSLLETDPLYQREYLGLAVYDTDAMVLRLTENNYYTDEQLVEWIESQSQDDLRFVAGLDYGMTASDALIIVLYSEKRNEKFIVYDYKKSGSDVTELREEIDRAKQYVLTDSKFKHCYRKTFDIYADNSDQKITKELSNRYGIAVHDAIKVDAAFGIQMLGEEARFGNLKIKAGSNLDVESRSTVFKRIENDGQPSIVTKEIDDEIYHPDSLKAAVYSLRLYWATHKPEHSGKSTPIIDERPTPEMDEMLKRNRRQL